MSEPAIRAAAILDLVQQPDQDGYVRAFKITWDGKPERYAMWQDLPVRYVNIQRQERGTA